MTKGTFKFAKPLRVMFACLMIFLAAAPCSVYAGEITDFEVILEDDARLLNESEEKQLSEQMNSITKYGNAAFKTIDNNTMSSENYASDYLAEHFNSDSAIVFLIDMDNREIAIWSNGDIYDVINSGYANSITDNVYTLATDEKYYECDSKAFEQMKTLLDGGKISQPMKYITNAFLAVIAAMIIGFLGVKLISKPKKASKKALLNAIDYKCEITDERAVYVRTSKCYSPKKSSSGGGSGGGGGGGGSYGF